jgi:hypothetical protein
MGLRRRFWNWRRRVWTKRYWEASKVIALCNFPDGDREYHTYRLEYYRGKKQVAEDRYWAAVAREAIKRLNVKLDRVLASGEGSLSNLNEGTDWAGRPPCRQFVPPGSEDPPTELVMARPPATR